MLANAARSAALVRFEEAKRVAFAVNPLDDVFSKKMINLSEFYSPFVPETKNAKFSDCYLLGPGMIHISGCHLEKANILTCQVVVIPETVAVVGATLFERCSFERCKFVHVTFLMNKQSLQEFNAQLGGGRKLDVISDGTCGPL